MRLAVFHFHDRPGGVRQVITRGLPRLLARLPEVRSVELILGEQTDPAWARRLAENLDGRPLHCTVDGRLGYADGQDGLSRKAIRAAWKGVLRGGAERRLLWAHNLGVGRNVPLLLELPRLCHESGTELWLHHHDWWWDGRWARWRDWRQAGISCLEEALARTVPAGTGIRHWCASQADLPWLEAVTATLTAATGAGRPESSAGWVGSPPPDLRLPGREEVRRAAAWLARRAGRKKVWLLPARALRRKNPAEALWLAMSHPDKDIALVTTGGASSPEEEPAWRNLCRMAARNRWPLIPEVLAGPAASRAPSVAALMAAADAVIMTSLQEGFGLPCLEAALLEKPFLARNWPGLAVTMEAAGVRGLQCYEALETRTGSCRAAAEWQRKRSGFCQKWVEILPRELVGMALEGPMAGEPPSASGAGGPAASSSVDFGTLSAAAQEEVMSDSLLAPVPSPGVPEWSGGWTADAAGAERNLSPGIGGREDVWAGRFFARRESTARRMSGSGPPPVAPEAALSLEVRRRFDYWLRHPLLWL